MAFTVQGVADSTFLANFGPDPATAIPAAIAKITAQFAFARSWLQRDVGLSLKVNSIDIRTAGNDPFLAPGNLWTQLRAYRASQPVKAGVYQLFYNGPKSTCNFLCEGQAASLNSICSENGLTINYRPATGTLVFSSILAAHEFGHVLNAVHTDGTACEDLRIPVEVCFGGSKAGLECESLLDCCANGPDHCTLLELSGGVNCFENPYRPIMWPGVSLSSEDDAEYEACAIGRITDKDVAAIWREDSCAYPISCGDADANGAIAAADAQLALQLSVCSGCAYNALADVNAPFAAVTTADALAILRIAVGSEVAPNTCGPL